MAKPRWGNVLRGVHSLLEEGVTGAVADSDLLQRYATGGRESAERAFAALVDRHGAMVLRVCRNVLRDRHAAEDAFQATFLVLARKAASLWVHDSIGPWLHGVAFRTSCCARNAAVRRRRHERQASEQTSQQTNTEEADDVGPILHQEIGRLPERYRAAVVLCYLEGLTHEQAGERLNCPVGTVRSRLATGRERLRRRLTARGMSPAHGDLEPAIDRAVSAMVIPAALAESAIRNALVDAATAAAGGVPAAVTALAKEGMRLMLLARLRPLALGLVLIAGGGAVGVVAFAQRPKAPAGFDVPKAPAVSSAPVPRTDRTFLEARIQTAREILRQDMQRLRIMVGEGDVGLEEIQVWSRHLMEDRLRLAGTPAERLDAIREHRNLMIALERMTTQWAATFQARTSDGLKGKYYRLEADQLLVEAGGDPQKEAPAPEPKQDAGPPPPASPLPSRTPRR
jgi:RNA polymerase sigma factor (sigma-70 family)